VLALIALIIAIWTIKNQNMSNTTISQLQNTQQQFNLQTQQHQQNFETTINQEVTKISEKVEQLIKQTTNLPAEQAKLQANQLIQLAQLQLQYSGNIAQAQQLLQFAAQQLASFNTEEIEGLKQKINQDIQALQRIPSVNKAEVLANLDNLIQQIQQIPLIPNSMTPAPQNNQSSPSANKGWWENIKRNLAKLKTFIVIHKVDSANSLALSPDENFILKQKILMKLTQAQWAVLNSQAKVYQQALQQTQTLLRSLRMTPALSQSINAKIQQLLAVPLTDKANIQLTSPTSVQPIKGE
jgi:uroporphyrin-3 C-methyltransferase